MSQTLEELKQKKEGIFRKVIELIEQERGKYRFCVGTIGFNHIVGVPEKHRCAIGLVLSHFGWDGNSKEPTNYSYHHALIAADRLVEYNTARLITCINDKSDSWEDLLTRLEFADRIMKPEDVEDVIRMLSNMPPPINQILLLAPSNDGG